MHPTRTLDSFPHEVPTTSAGRRGLAGSLSLVGVFRGVPGVSWAGALRTNDPTERTTEPKSDDFEPIGIDGDPLDFFDFDTKPEFFEFFCQLFTIQEVNRRSAIPSCLLDRFPWKSPCCYKKPFVGSANHSTA